MGIKDMFRKKPTPQEEQAHTMMLVSIAALDKGKADYEADPSSNPPVPKYARHARECAQEAMDAYEAHRWGDMGKWYTDWLELIEIVNDELDRWHAQHRPG